MTTTAAIAHARRILADLILDPAAPLDLQALRQDIARARRDFTEEELTDREHAARLDALATLEAHAYTFELTDTFGGKANYSWVRRGTIAAGTMRDAVRQAKAALGMTGHPCRRAEFGDQVALYPAGTCTVLIVTETTP
jgi:hypothetical protein